MSNINRILLPIKRFLNRQTTPTGYTLPDLQVELQQEGYALYHYDIGPFHSYPRFDEPWLTNTEFSEAYEKIREHTLVDRLRCYSLYLLAKQTQKVPGNILEVGVWRGGTAGILASFAPQKTVYAADTFVGVVKSQAWEEYTDGRHDDASEKDVADLLKTLKVENYKLLTGVFPEDTGKKLAKQRFSLVHIDVDVYQSAKDTFEFIWPRLSIGGIIVFDDYGFITPCIGVYKFVTEIQDDPDKLFVQNLNGHAYIIKTS